MVRDLHRLHRRQVDPPQHLGLGVGAEQQVERAVGDVQHRRAEVRVGVVSRRARPRRPQHTRRDRPRTHGLTHVAGHPHDPPRPRLGRRRAQTRRALRHLPAVEHLTHRHRPQHRRRATVMVGRRMRQDQKVQPPRTSVTQPSHDRTVRPAGVDEHGVLPVLDQRRVPLPHVEERHHQAVRRARAAGTRRPHPQRQDDRQRRCEPGRPRRPPQPRRPPPSCAGERAGHERIDRDRSRRRQARPRPPRRASAPRSAPASPDSRAAGRRATPGATRARAPPVPASRRSHRATSRAPRPARRAGSRRPTPRQAPEVQGDERRGAHGRRERERQRLGDRARHDPAQRQRKPGPDRQQATRRRRS